MLEIKKEFECNICEKCFDSNELPMQLKFKNYDENGFKCKFCKKVFTQKKKEFKCEVCEKRFETNEIQLEPKSKNHKENSFKCKLCNEDSTKRSLKIASLNIGRGLFSKEELLKYTMIEQNCDIMGVSEVDIEFFDEKKPFSIEGFKSFFPLQRAGTTTKRLLCFVKDGIEVTKREDLMSNLLSNVWLQIIDKSQKVLICLMYREFSDLTHKGQLSINEQIERLNIFHTQVEKASKEGLILIMGDMNINLEKWEDPNYYLKKLADEYHRLIGLCGLDLLNFGITWSRSQDNGSALDHGLCNKPEAIKNYYKTDIDYSDHSLIIVDLNVKVPKLHDSISTARDLRKLRNNPQFFISRLKKVDWGAFGYMNSIDDMETLWTKEINKCLDECAPWKVRRIKKKRYIFPKEVQMVIQKRKELLKKLKDTQQNGKKDTVLSHQFKKYNNYCNKVIKKAVREMTAANITSESKSKEVWKSINIILHPERIAKNNLKIKIEDQLIDDPLVLAEGFNNFFKDKIEKLVAAIKNPNVDPLSKLRKKMQGSNLRFNLKTVSENVVLKILKSLKSKKSCGQDGITSEVLKLGAEFLVTPLTYMINTSIRTGKFPENWKIAKIVPLHKKGDRKEMKNFRPLSLLSVSGMILEKVIALQIEEYFEKNNLLGSFQFGYRRGKNSTSELLTLFDQLLEAKQLKKEIMVVLYDLSAAFDTVSHEILLAKLKLYGFDKNSMNWVTSYLENRKQYVWLSGEKSSTIETNIGTPQGSRLSPLLFLILMADMELWTEESNLQNFADDSQSIAISETKESVVDITTKDANGIMTFFGCNHFVNNANKAALMYNSKGKGQEITLQDIGGEQLKSTNKEKLLGLHINSDFTWSTHIDEISKELRHKIGLLKRIKKRIPKNKIILVAEAIFNSKIRYGISVYLSPVFEEEDLKWKILPAGTRSLQTLQNDMLRAIHGLKRSQCVNMQKLREKIGMMSINQMSIYHTILEMHNIMNNSSSEKILSKFTHKQKHSSRKTANNDIRVPHPKKVPEKALKKCTGFSYCGPKLYNKLPREIKETNNLDTFKTLVKDWIWKTIPAY